MASTSETGHAKNVANFDDLISFALGYGTTYNPSKASLKVTAFQTLSTSAKAAINAVNAALPDQKPQKSLPFLPPTWIHSCNLKGTKDE